MITKKIIRKISLIGLVGLCFGWSSTLHSAQQNDPNTQQEAKEQVVEWTCTTCLYRHLSSKTELTPFCIRCRALRPGTYPPKAMVFSLGRKCPSIRYCPAFSLITACLQDWQVANKTGNMHHMCQHLLEDHKYKDIIDAYHHILRIHLSGHNQQDPYPYMYAHIQQTLPCSLTSCTSYTRNQRKQATEAPQADKDKPYLFLRDLLDTMHVYFVHAYDAGHRSSTLYTPQQPPKAQMHDVPDHDQKDEYKDDTAENDHTDVLCDSALKNLQKHLSNIKKSQQIQCRNSKFQTNLNTTNTSKKAQSISLDILQEKFSDDPVVKRWIQYLLDNECDTDNLLAEIEAQDHNEMVIPMYKTSEIKKLLNEKQVRKRHDYAQIKLYGFGIRLYYWKYYRNINSLDLYRPEYPLKALYVDPAYLSFKKELLAHKIPKPIWDQKYYEAEKFWRKSEACKGLHVTTNYYDTLPAIAEEYGFQEGDGIATPHILALLFYANFTDLAAAFSGSFRFLSPKESLPSLIKRNAQFHYLSKHLREVVEIFGEQIGYDREGNKIDKGSFYHGLSYPRFDTFSTHYYAPLSTSKRLEVATLFTQQEGAVVELTQATGQYDPKLRFFNVSLVSCFAVEEEMLFIGGDLPMQVSSIRVLKDNINMQPLIHTLFVVDHMLQGKKLSAQNQATARDVWLFNQLCNRAQDVPSYMQQVWQAFTHRYQVIKVNMFDMYEYYSPFCPVLLSPYVKNLLLLDKLVQVFPNLTKVVWEDADYDGNIFDKFGNKGDYSAAVVNSNLIQGLQAILAKLEKYTQHQLKIIKLKTYQNQISHRCDLAVMQFSRLRWNISKTIETQQYIGGVKSPLYYRYNTITLVKLPPLQPVSPGQLIFRRQREEDEASTSPDIEMTTASTLRKKNCIVM